MNVSNYNFTKDWFSRHIPRFELYLKEFKNKKVKFLEIGSYEGRSAIWVLENILNKESELVCVEPGFSLNGNETLKNNLSKFSNVKLIEKPNKEAWKDYIFDEFDFVYIDGSHSSKNCYFDMILGWIVLKQGGIMAVDDYNWPLKAIDGTSPKEAVDLFLEKNTCKVLHKGYQAWILKN